MTPGLYLSLRAEAQSRQKYDSRWLGPRIHAIRHPGEGGLELPVVSEVTYLIRVVHQLAWAAAQS